MVRILDDYSLFHTRDPQKAQYEVAKVHCDHKLVLNKGRQVNACYNHAPMSAMSINFIEYGAEVMIDTGELNSFFLIQLPIRGSAQIQSGKNEDISKVGIASIPSPDQRLRMRWSADCQQILIKLDRATVEQQLCNLIAGPLNEPIHFDLLMPSDSGKTAAWWRMIHLLINEFELGQRLHTSGPAVETLEQAVITNLLYIQHHNYTDRLFGRNISIAPVHVKRAEEFMRENIACAITIEDLAHVTGVSARTLHTGFKRFRHITPMNYLRNIRLENARHDLISPTNHMNITEVAAKWGFTQLGRFASIYKQTYGESPSETLRRYKQTQH